jgi:hypothetical protein
MLICLLTGVSLSLPAFSQETSRDLDYLRRQEGDIEAVDRAAERAERRKVVEDIKELTYQDVLSRPDDIQLNYRYAREQIARNNLLGAAATLQRILLIDPNLHPVRLLYGVVLYRLDALIEARQALESLDGVVLPPNVREEVDAYLRMIKRRQRKTRFGLRQTLGYGYDTNRNAAPSSKKRLFNDVALSVAATDGRTGDSHFVNMTSVDVAHDLGFAAGHELIGSFTYFLQEQKDVNSLSLGSFQYLFGGVYKSRWFNFTPTFDASHVFLSHENFLRTQAGNFQIDKNFFGKLDLFLATRVENRDFMNISENSNNVERKGIYTTVNGGAHYWLSPSMRLSADIGGGHKTAKRKYNAYNAFFMRASHTWLLGKGQFLVNTVRLENDRYVGVDEAIAGRHRRDNLFSYQVTYGAPLSFFFFRSPFLPKPLRDVTFSLAYQYFHATSTITNYSYVNNQFQGFFTKRLEF